MRLKHKFMVLGLLVGALIFTSACGMITSLLSGTSSGTVDDLWSDVPRMDGMTKANLDFPLAARLAIQAIMQGRMNFIAYTTDATPQGVLDFYTNERMAGQGWASQDSTGCFGSGESTEEGMICIFTKGSDNSNNELLAIVAANDPEIGKTAIFFARIDASEESIN